MLRAAIVCGLVVVLGACSNQAGPDAGAAGPSTTPSTPSAQPSSPSPTASADDALVGAYDEYVALGDSFTAGPLIAPQDPDGEACARSLANYPHQLAERLEVDLRDVSCSGADTTHLAARQSNLFGTNAPQLRALRESTDLVTLGIGGNDFGVFAQLVTGCARARSDDPDGAPCRAQVGDITGVFDETGARVEEALRAIEQRSPDADVLLVGYPRLTPDQGVCSAVLPFADGDYAFAREIERGLNEALRGAAAAAGVTFVDVAEAAVGHDACAGDQAWVNGRRTEQGVALSYHPFERGMAAVADLVQAELQPAGRGGS